MRTQQATRRRRGRAERKQARRRRDSPQAADAFQRLREAFQPAVDAVREAWNQIRTTLRPLMHFIAALSYRARPLIHNGRKYRR